MKDQIRARRLAIAAAILILVLLYALGGVGLYLRAHLPEAAWLEATATPQGALPGGDALPTVLAQDGPPSTLVPTITPRPGLAAVWAVTGFLATAAPGGFIACAP